MKIEDLQAKKLPDSPGVYFFQNAQGEILYIGRATSLRDRVKSYFKDDVIHTRGPLIIDMVVRSSNVDFVITDSVLEAVILEANLIKKYQPTANTKEKDDKSFNYIVITNEEFPTLLSVRGKDLIEHFPKGKAKYTFGPYPQGNILKEGLKIIRRIFPYRDEKCTPHQGKPCFNRQIGLCPGPCTDEISKTDYAKTIQNLKLFFEGHKGLLIKKLEKEMKMYAKEQLFEKASDTKRVIFALNHIQDISLIKAEFMTDTPHELEAKAKSKAASITGEVPQALFRMEAYDIAHMSGKHTAGVMVVLEDNHVKKSDYRLFKIRRTQGANDVAGLREVLDRRLNHSEWQFPNLIVVDGSTAQKNAADALLKERNFDIAVVGVVKNEKHQPERVIGDPEIVKKYKKEILLINSEAHRFAIKYHRKLRRIV